MFDRYLCGALSSGAPSDRPDAQWSVELSRVDPARLRQHLVDSYGVPIVHLNELDVGVFKAERADRSTWVVRVSQAGRPVSAVEADAAILKRLESTRFPAELCADPNPVTVLDEQGVLVTEFIPAAPPMRPGRTFALLGALLGALAAMPVTELRPGGAWHTLADGDPAAELRAARLMLDEAADSVPPEQRVLYEVLKTELAGIGDFDDLPTAFIHPDFVPPNALPTSDQRLIIIDWAGAGRGPRIWPLGFLLNAAGARSPKLVEVVVSYYRRRIEPTPTEIEHLEDAIFARRVVLAVWSYCVGRSTLSDALDEVQETERIAGETAAQVRELLSRPAKD